MIFKSAKYPDGLAELMPQTWISKVGRWQFLIIKADGVFTASCRLINPAREVSASSTVMGPFDTFDDAENAARGKWAEIKRLS